jgi:hypothetical protein
MDFSEKLRLGIGVLGDLGFDGVFDSRFCDYMSV